MQTIIRKTLIAFAITASFSASSGAMAQSFPDFTVDESAISGALARTFTADKITGNYVEVITFSGSGTNGTFDVALKWNAGQFVGNNGTTVVSNQLGAVTSNQYGLYALYQGSGTFSATASGTVFNFNSGGSLSIFADSQSDTQFVQPTNGNIAFSTTSSGDDVLIAAGVPTSGQGRLDPTLTTCGAQGINCGSFGASSTIDLTAAGSEYFVAPNPFYNVSFQSGQLNNFTPIGTQVINGSLDVIFANAGNEVPEPATATMIGLGLLGLGLARRRSTKA